MYIPEFICGMVFAILLEIIVIIIAAVIYEKKTRNKSMIKKENEK